MKSRKELEKIIHNILSNMYDQGYTIVTVEMVLKQLTTNINDFTTYTKQLIASAIENVLHYFNGDIEKELSVYILNSSSKYYFTYYSTTPIKIKWKGAKLMKENIYLIKLLNTNSLIPITTMI